MADARIIDQALLEAVAGQARAVPRRRSNHNFHGAAEDPGHRLLNAVEPDSYVPPHRHLDPAKGETLVVLRGAFGLVLFDDAGVPRAQLRLEAGGPALGVDLPPGTWHTVISLESGSVFLEAKAGPFRPLEAAERAPWAPAEGAPGAEAYHAGLRRLFAPAAGDCKQVEEDGWTSNA